MSRGDSKPPVQAEVERIVRQVLAELTQAQYAAASEPSDGELVVTSRVISLKELEDKLKGISRLVVPRGAVITPAARDHLKQKHIAVASAVGNKPKPNGQLIVATAETNFAAATLAKSIEQAGWNVEQLGNVDIIAAVDQLAARLRSGETRGVLLTSNLSAALCLANRSREMRAALATNVATVTTAVQAIDANLLVIEPTGRGWFELRQMVFAFLKSGPGACLSQLWARLN